MTDDLIIKEIIKAFQLLHEDTYTKDDFAAHMMQVINDVRMIGHEHKNQMERLLYKVHELRETQRKFHCGHKQLLGDCKRLETEMDLKTSNLIKMGKYSIERFTNQPEQKGLF